MLFSKMMIGFLFFFFVSSSFLQAVEGFKDNQKFHRTKANSPVYLLTSSEVIVKNDGYNLKRPGFKIFKLGTDQEVGYITTVYKPFENIIEISWIYIDEQYRNKSYATAALQTVEGIYKKHKNKFPEAHKLWISVAESNEPMKHVCEKLGFKKTSTVPLFVNLEKEILNTKEP